MWAAIATLAWPVMIDQILGTVVGLVDTILAAGISEAAADAVGSASYIMWFVGLFFVSLDIGATALIARSIGAGRRAVANAAVGQSLLLALAIGCALGVVLFTAAPLLVRIMSLKGEAAGEFITFLRIMAIDAPVIAVMYAGIACLRGAGDTLRPMRALLVVNVVNLIASWSLAGVDLAITRDVNGVATRHVWLHNPFGFNLGVAGIGLGTMLGHLCGAALILITLARGTASIRIIGRRLRPHWVTLARILRVGFPSFLEMVGMWFGNFLVVLIVGLVGAGVVGAHMIAIRVEAFSFQLGFAIAIASATLAGQYLGAGSPEMARRAIVRCAVVAAAIMGTIGLLFVLIPHTIVGLVSGQPTHLAQTPSALFITGLVQIPFAIGIVLRQAMRGVGDVRATMWITWLSTYAARLPLVYLFSGVALPLPSWLGGGTFANPLGLEPSLRGVWIGLSIEIVIRGAAFFARFLQGGWAKSRV